MFVRYLLADAMFDSIHTDWVCPTLTESKSSEFWFWTVYNIVWNKNKSNAYTKQPHTHTYIHTLYVCVNRSWKYWMNEWATPTWIWHHIIRKSLLRIRIIIIMKVVNFIVNSLSLSLSVAVPYANTIHESNFKNVLAIWILF